MITNKILDGVFKAKKLAGRELAVQHKPFILESDCNKIQDNFDDVLTTLNPPNLSFYVRFNFAFLQTFAFVAVKFRAN